MPVTPSPHALQSISLMCTTSYLDATSYTIAGDREINNLQFKVLHLVHLKNQKRGEKFLHLMGRESPTSVEAKKALTKEER